MMLAGRANAALVLLMAGLWSVSASPALAQNESGVPVSIRLGNGSRIVRVRPGPGSLRPSGQAKTLTTAAATATTTYAYPQPPLNGFSPLVAITTSDKKKGSYDQDMAHVVESTYAGLPLNAPAESNFVVGIWDSGSVLDMVADPYTAVVGLQNAYDGYTFPIGGVGGDIIYGDLTYPIGYFAAGLGAINSSGQLDLTQLKGHSNTTVLGLPELTCGNGESLIAVVGTPLLAFYKAMIRIDDPKEVTVDGQVYKSPNVQILTSIDSGTLTQFPRVLSLDVNGGPITTAAYYPDIFAPGGPDFDTPWIPTLCSMMAGEMSNGAGFTGTVWMRQGPSTPDNPVQPFTMMVDTGAQASIISSSVVTGLNLDLYNPDFYIDICGVGGLTTASGYWIDYVKLNAGGALEFAHAPFVVQDLSAPDGTPLDGVLGMNFFWNRNVILDPSMNTSGYLTAVFRIGNPIPLAYGDFDRDLDVDSRDLEFFTQCMSGPAIIVTDPVCPFADADGDGDVDEDDFGVFQRCISGAGVHANVNCGPAR